MYLHEITRLYRWYCYVPAWLFGLVMVALITKAADNIAERRWLKSRLPYRRVEIGERLAQVYFLYSYVFAIPKAVSLIAMRVPLWGWDGAFPAPVGIIAFHAFYGPIACAVPIIVVAGAFALVVTLIVGIVRGAQRCATFGIRESFHIVTNQFLWCAQWKLSADSWNPWRRFDESTIKALARKRTHRATELLVQAMEHGWSEKASRILIEQHRTDAIGPLFALLEKGSGGVSSAAKVLEALSWAPTNAAERVLFAIAKRDAEGVGREGDFAVDYLLCRQDDERWVAVALGKTGSVRAVQPVLNYAKTLDWFDGSTIDALVQLINTVRGDIPEEILDNIGWLRDSKKMVYWETGTDRCNNPTCGSEQVPVDLSHVRQLARQRIVWQRERRNDTGTKISATGSVHVAAACRCGARYRVKVEFAGRTFTCPNCRGVFVVPMASR